MFTRSQSLQHSINTVGLEMDSGKGDNTVDANSSQTNEMMEMLKTICSNQGESSSQIRDLTGRINTLERELSGLNVSGAHIATPKRSDAFVTSHAQGVGANLASQTPAQGQASTRFDHADGGFHALGHAYGIDQNRLDYYDSQNHSSEFVDRGIGYQGYQDHRYSPRNTMYNPNQGFSREQNQDYRHEREETGMIGIRVKPYIAKESDWFSYRVYYEQISSLAGWSDKVKCIKLLGALQGNLSAVSLGMDSNNITFAGLLRRLDEVHGTSSDRLDASRKLSTCRQRDLETMALFAERVRQMVFRAYPSTNQVDQEELGLRAFLQGLTSKNNVKFEVNKQMFSSLKQAVEFGTNLEICLRDELTSGKSFNSRSVSDGSNVENYTKVCEAVCRAMQQKSTGQGNSWQNNSSEKRTPLNSPCVLCKQFGHWKNECPNGKPANQPMHVNPQVSSNPNPQANSLNCPPAHLRGAMCHF